MQHEEDIKELFVKNAIHLIAEGGFEKATTKELTHCSGPLPDFKMNEVYIYRLFGSKDHLYEVAFIAVDTEMCVAFCNGIKSIGDLEENAVEKLYSFFLKAWRFMLEDEERCRYYVRYYYSIYFKDASVKAHQKLFEGVIDAMSPLFKEDTDVFSILHSVFTTLLDFAIRVYNKDLEDNETNRLLVFKVLYYTMMPYFKENIQKNARFLK
jgi:AcrR family transcriptional regulator